MALIEYRHCPHCGKTTWQEFVPQLSSACSYWRCRDCGDRRKAKRISISDSDLLHRGRLQTEMTCADVFIVDISRSGAKLRLDEEMPISLHLDQTVLFNPQLQPFGELAQYIPSLVRWMDGPEFGLLFPRPLTISTGDIMRIVKN
jgi:hypothetical protein